MSRHSSGELAGAACRTAIHVGPIEADARATFGEVERDAFGSAHDLVGEGFAPATDLRLEWFEASDDGERRF